MLIVSVDLCYYVGYFLVLFFGIVLGCGGDGLVKVCGQQQCYFIQLVVGFQLVMVRMIDQVVYQQLVYQVMQVVIGILGVWCYLVIDGKKGIIEVGQLVGGEGEDYYGVGFGVVQVLVMVVVNDCQFVGDEWL